MATRPTASAKGNANLFTTTKSPAVDDLGVLRMERDAFAKIRASGSVDLRETAQAAQALDEEKKVTMIRKALIGSIIVSLLIIVGQKAISIYLTYKDFIKGIAKDMPSQWPTSAYMTAAAVEIPALSGLTGFPTSALPIAAYYCYSSANIYPKFKPDATANLSSMFETAAEGNKDPDAAPSFNAVTIICKSWLGASDPGVDLCVTPCPQQRGVGWAGVASAGLGGATTMAFAGHSVATVAAEGAAGPIGIASALVGFGLSAATSYLDQKRREKQEAANTDGRACRPD